MIDVYSWATPNGHKVHIMLEECELPYRVHGINIGAGDQFKPDFLKISPNNKIPAIVDQDGPDGKPISLFESGAILLYLAGKTGKFLPDAAHLEHQPLQHFVLAAGVGRQQPPGLAGEVEQDGAALEQRDGRAIGALGVGDGRDLVVRADGEEVGRELVAGADVHGKHPVGQATLLKHDVHLVAVRGGP